MAVKPKEPSGPTNLDSPAPKSTRVRLGAVALRDPPVGTPREHRGGPIFIDPSPVPHVTIGDKRYPLAAVAWWQFPQDLK